MIGVRLTTSLPDMKLQPAAILLFCLVAACAEAPRQPAPEHPSAAPTPRIAQTANPYATKAALEMLDRGGNAIDAIVAAQMVLGLVEPQMSGPGGGTAILYWDAASAKLTSFDGLAAAPSHTTASLRTGVDGAILPRDAVYRGGRSVGVPGTIPVLQMVHRRYGKLPWKILFGPAIDLAQRGFALPEFLHRVVEEDHVTLAQYPDLRLYFDARGKPLPVGSLVRNPEYAKTLGRIAERGVDGLLADGGAERIVEAAHHGVLPTFMTPSDLRDYRPVERAPVCGSFLAYRLCTLGPPSYGGIYLLQVLGMLEERSGGAYDFGDPRFVHLWLEAGKLARADRIKYVGDPDFTPVPTAGLVSPGYVRARAESIDALRADPSPRAGTPPGVVASLAPGKELAMGGTSQLTVADGAGNVVAMTTTNNLGFGSGLMVDGYVLNDVLVNFSAAPRPGQSIANAMAPRKRPFTSVSPTIVFDASGRPVAAGGSAGGGRIPDYVSQGWIEILARGATPAQAIARGHFSTATPGKILVEAGSEAERLAPALRALGHVVESAPLPSGAGYIERVGNGWIGAADPRRGGNAAGD
jgi:gamma-glutamyltranspeptidase/glutathione hydrolase